MQNTENKESKGNMMGKNMARLFALSMVVVLAAGCGQEDPAGPDVTGWTLPAAQKALKKAGVHAQVHSDALFGVVIPENFTVCKIEPLNSKAVRLEVSKYEC